MMSTTSAHLRSIDGTSVSTDSISIGDLAERFEPVVLRGLCADWPATQAEYGHEMGYLRQFDSGRSAEAFIGNPSIGGRYDYSPDMAGFNFSRESLAFGDALTRIADAAAAPERSSVYVGSLPIDAYLPGFTDQNALSILPAKVRPRIWIGTASSVACHYDTFDNVACVIAGRRRFTLYPPDAIRDLYVGPIDHTLAGQPISLAASALADDPRYPNFASAKARAIVVELGPGDALYLPKLWWHAVEATAPVNILVNYWWDAAASGPDAPYTSMLLAMIAIAERPEPERAAWRSFFDHYVFRPDGHPLRHLPPHRHGILGPLGAGNYGRIRSLVMRWLRGG